MALDVDQFVYDHPDFLPVIAAGNEGSCLPGMGSDKGFVDYPSLGAPATAKNGLTVGASRSSRKGGGISQNSTWVDAWPDDFGHAPIAGKKSPATIQCLAAFSSRGPCDDHADQARRRRSRHRHRRRQIQGRAAPQFLGRLSRQRQYGFMGGTSMACPMPPAARCWSANVSAFTRLNTREPSAALIKATLINGTQRITGDDAIARPAATRTITRGSAASIWRTPSPTRLIPDFELYVADSLEARRPFAVHGKERPAALGIDMKAPGALRITLAWTDPPGRALQNQLRLILDTRVGGQPRNWVGNEHAAAPLKVPSHDPRLLLPGMANVLTRDPHNNVQVIRVNAVKGAYTLALFADSLLKLPQDFALVISCPAGSAEIRED